MQISWKMLNYFASYAKSLQLHKDWAPSVKSCQINSTSALYCFTSNGFFPYQLLLPQAQAWELSMVLLVCWRMFWFVSWCRVNFGRKLSKGFGKQLKWVDTGMAHSMLENPLVPYLREALLPVFLHLLQELLVFFPFYSFAVQVALIINKGRQ